MEAFVSRKRRRESPVDENVPDDSLLQSLGSPVAEDSTDLKLAVLASLYPDVDQNDLLDILISSDGSVNAACLALSPKTIPLRKKSATASIGIQSSLSSFAATSSDGAIPSKPLTRKGRTLHLYAAKDIVEHTPCSIIHNFLPSDEATSLLQELLNEAPTFERQTFKVFDNVVQSPHSACFYVHNLDEAQKQKTEYLYNGSFLTDVRQITPEMRKVSSKVQEAVNTEIEKRIKSHYPDGKKLKYQSPKEWIPNAAFVNCYASGSESVGYHSDHLTYLGPRAVIGSLSLGVAREFRVRRIVAHDVEETTNGTTEAKRQEGIESTSPKKPQPRPTHIADAEGQISIHLPHNSLLVMHAEMQEEWKHSIHPAQAIDPHPIAGNKRINITYRCYRDSFHPRYTPRCRCGVATVLRCVQRKKENRGRYMWMCYAGLTPGKEGCPFFQWAEFDEDGEPPWMKERD